jgi:N-acetyl-gamma-glutamyl-phosphate reductase
VAKIFIDGSAGTTGLRIRERLAERTDIELITLTEELRKDTNARREALNSADIAFLCLPDAAAIEAVSLIDNEKTAVIDTSTAHRTNPAWEYGFPELSGRRERIAKARRIANPGCHASGFVALVEPLVRAGVIAPETALTCTSLTGYSGGGKKMIAEYEGEGRDTLLGAPRLYGLSQSHKHLPEMAKICGLDKDPIFAPIVAPFYSGMEVMIPLFTNSVKGGIEAVKEVYRKKYTGNIVSYVESDGTGMISAHALAGKDSMQITVAGNEERILLVAMYDNLGKGASGAAVECMNYVLGVAPETGLSL